MTMLDSISSMVSTRTRIVKFLLMNKDDIVLKFNYVEESPISYYYEEVTENIAPLPIGYNDIESWLLGRKAPSHRKHISELCDRFNCNTTLGYIMFTHAVSLNDSFWVKEVSDNISWIDVSPYDNRFSDIIARCAFTGEYSMGVLGVPTPEFSTDGSYPKCWRKEDDGIYLYKSGSETYNNVEPVKECLSSLIYSKLCNSSVSYELSSLYNITSSKCKLFTSDDVGLVSAAKVLNKGKASIEELLKLCSSVSSEDEFIRMLIADSVVMNTDRHLGNIGFLVSNKSQTVLGLSPIFDFNRTLIPELSEELYYDKSQFRNILKNQIPKLGTNFREVARYFLNEEIRSILVDIKEFVYSDSMYFTGSFERESAREIIITNIDSILL